MATERLPWPINSEYGEFDFIVAPDDSYLIFASDRPGGYGQDDNYICFRRDDGRWTHPVNMGTRVNSYGNEMRSFVSHDQKAFFFGSTRRAVVPKGEVFESEAAVKYGDNDVYWIDGSIISELKETMFAKTCAAELVRQELLENGVFEEKKSQVSNSVLDLSENDKILEARQDVGSLGQAKLQ